MKKSHLLLLFTLLSLVSYAQNVGIGIQTPAVPLHVNSTTSAFEVMRLQSNNNQGSILSIWNDSARKGFMGLVNNQDDFKIGTYPGPGKLQFVMETSNTAMTILPNGNVGIGAVDPVAKLEVNGQLKIIDGNEGENKVLVSDANGLASWAASPSMPAPTYSIGDFAQGGVVFWVSPSGEHGKVVSIYDIGFVSWSNVTDSIGFTAESEINGAGNTVAIIMQEGHSISAARHCADLAYGGYDDWYLPSKDELFSIVPNRAAINATATANGGEAFNSSLYYWSSTENNNLAWGLFLNGNDGFFTSKIVKSRVRAIRAF